MIDIEEVKNRLNIVDVIGSYLELKPAGSNLKAVCPFHNEKTPSFTVNPSLGIFKCFGCGKGGDVIRFIQEMEKVDFRKALEIAAEKAGIQIDEINFTHDKEKDEKRKKIIEANTLTAKLYSYILKTHKTGKIARDYITKRGITAELIDKFNFGYAPNSYSTLKNFLIKKGFLEKDLVEWGLLISKGNTTVDKFRNRLIQPIYDLKGDIVGFSGRYLGTSDKAPKYLNSPETFIYKKKEVLYGLYQSLNSIRKEKYVILVEGNLDVVSPHKEGIYNVVGPLGTAFTDSQAKILKRFIDTIYFCFDSDSAGINALIKSLQIVEEQGIRHKVIDLGEFKDPDEVVNKSPGTLRKLISEAKDTPSFLFSHFEKDIDLGSANGKMAFRDKAIPILKSLKDEIQLNHYAKQLAILLDVSIDEILMKVQKQPKNISYLKKENTEEILVNEKEPIQNEVEVYLLAILIQNTNLLKNIPELDIFFDINIKELIETIKEVGGELTKEVLDTLSQNSIEIYKNALMVDLSGIKDLEKEALGITKRLTKEYYRNEILKLRKHLLLNEEDIESITKLTSLSKELKKL